jgi:hypothetical protein
MLGTRLNEGELQACLHFYPGIFEKLHGVHMNPQITWCTSSVLNVPRQAAMDKMDGDGSGEVEFDELFAVRARPGRLSALSVSHSKSVLFGAFVWVRGALNHRKRRSPAVVDRAGDGLGDEQGPGADGARAGRGSSFSSV